VEESNFLRWEGFNGLSTDMICEKNQKSFLALSHVIGWSIMFCGDSCFKKKCPITIYHSKNKCCRLQNMIGSLFQAQSCIIVGLNWKLQQDNAPIHVSMSTIAYFEEQNINIFQNWWAKLPDIMGNFSSTCLCWRMIGLTYPWTN